VLYLHVSDLPPGSGIVRGFDCYDLLSECMTLHYPMGCLFLHVSVPIPGTGVDHDRRSSTALGFDCFDLYQHLCLLCCLMGCFLTCKLFLGTGVSHGRRSS